MPVMPETFTAKLTHARLVTPRVRELVFERVDGRDFSFTPGQWVSLVLGEDEGGRPVRRSYSIASRAPGKTLELVVTKVDGGRGSKVLHDAKVGAVFELKGPQGMFTRPVEGAPPTLFVATGTGVAPFRAMLHAALANGNQEPMWILYGVRDVGDALYAQEFRALAAKHPNVRLELSLSRPSGQWDGRTGYVQTHVKALFSELSAHGVAHAWLCGVKKMLLTTRDVLKNELGVERQRLHLESYD